MDNSELHFIEYDPGNVWDEMQRTYIEYGGDILYPGDEKEILLRSVLAIAEAIMAKVDNALRMDTLTYATGEYLKEYGQKRNCVYIDAIAATAPVTMTFAAGGTATTLPAGTEMTADGTVIYATETDLQITGTAQSIDTTLICTTPGAVGNGLPTGSQMQFIGNVDGFVSAITTADASGGVDAEEQEVYRERIREYGLASVTTGPAQQYESAATAVSTQILDAKAARDGDGEVGIYLILAPEAETASILASVQQALSDQTTRPLTDHVTVDVAGALPYSLEVKVWYSLYEGIDVDSVASAYKAWQDNRIGRAFNPDKLVAMLYQAGCERVQITGGSGVGEDIEYTEIPYNKHCSGTITITVVNT